MKYFLILCLIIIITNTTIKAQRCGTPIPTPQLKCGTVVDDSMTKTANQQQIMRGLEDNTYCINVFFHIVQDNNGNIPYSHPDLDGAMDKLNKFYNGHGIFFKNVGHDYINNDTLLTFNFQNSTSTPTDEYGLNPFKNTKNKRDAINIYIIQKFVQAYSGASIVGSNFCAVINNKLKTSTVAHEVGHCFGLYHTFHTEIDTELVDGSNCQDAGDLVCDTPADYYNGNDTFVNPLPDGYNPDQTNIMSYYQSRDHFTKGQAVRIRYGIHTYLPNILSQNCTIPSIIGSNNWCYHPNKEYTYTFKNIQSNVESWELSGVKKVSSTLNSITVKRSGNSKMGSIKAVFVGGYSIQKGFMIEGPFLNGISISGPNKMSIGERAIFSIDTKFSEGDWGASGHFKILDSGDDYVEVQAVEAGPGDVVYSYKSCDFEIICAKVEVPGYNPHGGQVVIGLMDACDKNDDEDPFDLVIYPNPSIGGKMHIELKRENDAFSKVSRSVERNTVFKNSKVFLAIFSAKDYKMVLQQEFDTESMHINTSNFKKGKYYCIITQGNNRKLKTFIIQ